MLKFQHLRGYVLVHCCHAGGVAAWSCEARDETGPYRVIDREHDNWHRGHEPLRRAHRRYGVHKNNTDAGLRQLARHIGKSLVVSGRVTLFQDVVAAFNHAVGV